MASKLRITVYQQPRHCNKRHHIRNASRTISIPGSWRDIETVIGALRADWGDGRRLSELRAPQPGG